MEDGKIADPGTGLDDLGELVLALIVALLVGFAAKYLATSPWLGALAGFIAFCVVIKYFDKRRMSSL